MTIQFFSTMESKKIDFVPEKEGEVKIYSCGPTVYNFAHLGNFRSYVFTDVLRRFLKFAGYRVEHCMNITDVDDKTIRGAIAEEISLSEFTKKYTEEFFIDLKKLNIEKVEHYPRATHSIEAMQDLLKRLDEKGYIYKKDNSLYFALKKFTNYGKLSKLDVSGIQSGSRYDADEYTKDDVRDFVLWKAPKEEKENSWPSDFGAGRPGWHLECSAMIHDVFGGGIDIHTGGIDLVFPHHENEIAQSVCAYDDSHFVRNWLHNEHLLVEGKKMSKTLGNFYTLRDLEDKGYNVRSIRYVLLASHYRSKLNFTLSGLDGANSALKRIDNFVSKLLKRAGREEFTHTENLNYYSKYKEQFLAQVSYKELNKLNNKEQQSNMLSEKVKANLTVNEYNIKFAKFMSDDLNTPRALGLLFEAIKDINDRLKILEGTENYFTKENASNYLSLFAVWETIFSFIHFGNTGEDSSAASTASKDESSTDLDTVKIESMLLERNQAKQNKDWTMADKIRDELADMGIVIEDGKTGSTWKKV